jgi:hypothetical protein
MRKIALFIGVGAVLVLIGIDALLSVRTLGPTDQPNGPYMTVAHRDRTTP